MLVVQLCLSGINALGQQRKYKEGGYFVYLHPSLANSPPFIDVPVAKVMFTNLWKVLMQACSQGTNDKVLLMTVPEMCVIFINESLMQMKMLVNLLRWN